MLLHIGSVLHVFLLVALAAASQSRVHTHSKSKRTQTRCCRFSALYEDADWHDPKTQVQFMIDALTAERRFFATPRVSYDPDTGMTYDGHALDVETGELLKGGFPAGPRTWSAASKEAMHLSLLALSLSPPPRLPKTITKLLIDPHKALHILSLKVASLEAFDRSYPGYGGFLPWFCSRGSKGFPGTNVTACRDLTDAAGPITPTFDWTTKVPALDNGQMAWAIYAAAGALEQHNQSLAARWTKRLERGWQSRK